MSATRAVQRMRIHCLSLTVLTYPCVYQVARCRIRVVRCHHILYSKPPRYLYYTFVDLIATYYSQKNVTLTLHSPVVCRVARSGPRLLMAAAKVAVATRHVLLP